MLPVLYVFCLVFVCLMINKIKFIANGTKWFFDNFFKIYFIIFRIELLVDSEERQVRFVKWPKT
jgi:hypothetical protein